MGSERLQVWWRRTSDNFPVLVCSTTSERKAVRDAIDFVEKQQSGECVIAVAASWQDPSHVVQTTVKMDADDYHARVSPCRQAILYWLRDNPASKAEDIARGARYEVSTVRNELTALRKAGLTHADRVGKVFLWSVTEA